MADTEPTIVNDKQAQRFELARSPDTAHLDYRESDGRLVLIHTEVEDDVEGQGVGSALVRSALAYAQEANLTVVPRCRFVAGWLERHPDRAAELDIEEG